MTKDFRAFQYKQRLLFTIIAQQKKGLQIIATPLSFQSECGNLNPGPTEHSLKKTL